MPADTGPLRIVDLDAKTAPGEGDLFELVDVSDTGDPKASDADGSSKKVTFANLQSTILAGLTADAVDALFSSPPLLSGNNLSDLTSASTARTNLGLGSAATHAATDFDVSGAAATALTTAEAYTDASVAGLVPTSRTLTAGTGLSGGGDLSADRSFALANTAVTAGNYTNANITVDAQGRITAASNGSGGTTYAADETTLHLSGTTFGIISTYAGQTSITTLGTVSTGTWSATTIAVNKGGTGKTSATAHAVQVGNGTSAMTDLAVGATGTVLIGNTGADPSWSGGPQLFPPASGGAQSLIGQSVSTDVGVFVNPAASITSGNRYYTLAVQATAAQTGGSSTGHVVPFYTAVESNTAGAYIWSLNSLISIASGMTSGHGQAYEVDVNNNGADSLTPASSLVVYGVAVSGAGSKRSIAPFSVQGPTSGWNYGLAFYNNSLSGGQAYVYSADTTFPAYGINFSTASFGTAAIQLASGQWNGDGTKLGVGVNPTHPLDVQVSANSIQNLVTLKNASSGTSAQVYLALVLGSDGATGLTFGCQAKTAASPSSFLNDNENGRDIQFGTTTSGGTTATRLTLDHNGNVVVGTAAVATNATDGFLYLDSCAGTPTGTPTSFTGRVPLVVDSTNKLLYGYVGGWQNLSGSSGTSSPLTTKGDVWGYSTTNARIPVGTDGQVLTADSTQTLGLKWATPSGSASGTNHSLILGTGASIGSLGVATNGQIPIGSTGADPVLATITPGAGVTVTNGAGSITIAASGTGGAVASVNYLANSGMWFAQRQTPGTLTTITSDKYSADRFRICRETASLQYSRTDTNGSQESGLSARYYGNFKQITSAGKFIVFQPLEGAETYDLAGQTVTLQVKLKASSAKTIRLGAFYLASAGTMDTLPATTSSTFGASGTDPTLGTNLSYVAGTSVPSGANGTLNGNAVDCSVTTSWQLFALTFTVPATAKNLCLAVWSDSQFSAGDILSASEWGLYLSSLVQSWQPEPTQQRLARCQRFFEKNWDVDTVPGTTGSFFTEWSSAGANAWTTLVYKVTKFAAPTITTYSPNSGTSGKLYDFTGSADVTSGSDGAGTHQAAIFSSSVVAGGHAMRANWTAESEL